MAKKTQDILAKAPVTNKDFIERAQAIEDEKQIKKRERQEKKEEKERKKKQQKIEKLVAPVLLMITIAVSIIVQLLSKF